MNQSAGALAVEQSRGRDYPLKSLGYENQQRAQSYALFPPSGALLFVAVQCGSVLSGAFRFGSLILVFPPNGAVRAVQHFG